MRRPAHDLGAGAHRGRPGPASRGRPATLRTWDRRYGLGPTGHAAGCAPALHPRRRAAARADASAHPGGRLAGRGGPGRAWRPTPTTRRRPEQRPAEGERGSSRSHGTDAAVRGLARAALALDARSHRPHRRRGACETHGVLWTWDALHRPSADRDRGALGGSRQRRRRRAPAGRERAAVPCARSTPRPRNRGTPARSCWPAPPRSCTRCRCTRWPPRWPSGGSTPGCWGPGSLPEALAAAVRRGGASAVFVWAHRHRWPIAEQVAAIPAMRPPVVGRGRWTRVGGRSARAGHLGQPR